LFGQYTGHESYERLVCLRKLFDFRATKSNSLAEFLLGPDNLSKNHLEIESLACKDALAAKTPNVCTETLISSRTTEDL